jgi:phosphatidylserine/phosphatidylglycerophosphate/cardiolipin synthase-like enzyme
LTKRLARGVGFALVALLLGALPLPAVPIPTAPQLVVNGTYGSTLMNLIRGAKRRITCVFYLFRTGSSAGNQPRAVAAELIAARRRGVEVTVVLDGGRSVGSENRATARLLSRGGIRVLFPGAGVTTHAKAVSIDDRYLLIGSHNLTQSALTLNNELSLVIDSPQLAGQVRGYLERLR